MNDVEKMIRARDIVFGETEDFLPDAYSPEMTLKERLEEYERNMDYPNVKLSIFSRQQYNRQTADEWIKQYKSLQKFKGRHMKMASGPDFYNGIKKIYQRHRLGDKYAKSRMGQLRDGMTGHELILNTRIYCDYENRASIMHDYDTNEQKNIRIDIPFPAYLIFKSSAIENVSFLQGIFGTKDSNIEMETVLSFFTGSDPDIMQVDTKLKNNTYFKLGLWYDQKTFRIWMNEKLDVEGYTYDAEYLDNKVKPR